jgi:NAD(P)-dependent dehydrogenase (short-subunit alcohol dehydrogenase family)
VSIIDINTEMGHSVVKSLAEEFPLSSPTFKECDISNWDSLAATFKNIYQGRGSIDIVVTNAGITKQGKLT